MKINSEFTKLRAGYLFTEIVNRTEAYQQAHPDARVLRLGVGDVQGPLAPCVLEAMHRAVDEQADTRTFHGYGPEIGIRSLRQAVLDFDYKRRGIDVDLDEIFISDGAGSDLGNLSDILDRDNRVAIADPVYPAYIDTNVMAGRAGEWLVDHWSRIILLPCTPENGFCPAFPEEVPDVIYLCSPNNPTGTALTKPQLQAWVDYARAHRSLIIFDAAYEAFVSTPDVPHSIYECEGAKEVAIEIRSFSKTAGFTGIRCGYTVVPKALCGRSNTGEEVSLNPLWNRRQCTKFNGASIIAQRGAEAVLTEEGHRQVMEQIARYKANAARIREVLAACGWEVFGGTDGPYIWCRVPEGYDSWSFFDYLLNEVQIVCTPGEGFGRYGRGYVRFSAFGSAELVEEAMERMKKILNR